VYSSRVSKRPSDARSGVSVVPSAPTTEAVSQLVETNLRLVVKFAHRFQYCGLPTVDLIHAGNIGLVEAARRFQPSRHASFVGYASWWVRQAMVHAISDRANAPLLSPSVVTTPACDPLPLALPADAAEIADELERIALELDDEIEAELDETYHDIQLRASGTPRQADRLRSQLN
jgi:RNA polymerase sigma factor (sigma-70 family)